MRTVSLIGALVLFLHTSPLFSQCNCPAIPITAGIIDTVSTVSELQSALQAADANGGNYTILLENGTYNLTSELLFIGTGMPNLMIRSLSGNRDSVIIEGQGMNGSINYIFNVAASNFTAADMTLGWVHYHGIQIHCENSADSALIQNIRFVDINEQMIKGSGSQATTYSFGTIIQCCLFEFPGGVANQFYTGGIDCHHGMNWEVRSNTFRNIRSPNSILAEHAVHFWSESEGTLVENNLIINCDRGVGFGLSNSVGKGHFGGIIRNNFIHTTTDVGIGLEQSRNTKVYNNTLMTENYFNSIEYRFDSTYGCLITNNLTDKTIASRNNGAATLNTNYEYSNTNIFVNASSQDFRLAGMDANIVDAGTTIQDVSMDFDCEVRPEGLGYDIGADEWNVPVGMLELENKELLIWPNPFTDRIQISGEGDTYFTIVDQLGRVIHSKRKMTKYLEVDLSSLKVGVYFLISEGYSPVKLLKLMN